MNKIKLVLVATMFFLFFACESKTDIDFSIIPIKGANGDYQYIDMKQKGKIVINPQFNTARYFKEDLALVKTSGKEGKWGYIDKKSKYAIAPVYIKAQDFNEGMAWVQVEGQPPMLIDKKGKMLLQIDSLVSAKPFVDGISTISVYSQSQGQEFVKFINKKGEMAAKTIDGEAMELFLSDSLYAFQNIETEKWGFKNVNGETIVSPQFDGSNKFIDGMAIVRSGEKWGTIDKKGNFIINPQYDGLVYDKDGLFIAQVGKKFGWVNKKNEMVINPQYDAVKGFARNKLAPVQMGGKWAYIDKKGKVVINPQFDGAYSFSEDYAMIENNKKIGFINKKGNLIVPPLYDTDSSVNSSDDFLPYAKLIQKMEAWREMEYEKARKAAEVAKESSQEEKPTRSSRIITFTDSRDDKKYKITEIGNQVWMKEDLNYEESGSVCYDNDSKNCDKYGRLYNWKTAKNVCPSGWHLPSDAEWEILVRTAGGSELAGKNLKAKFGWPRGNNGLDIYGFTALPGGNAASDSIFNRIGSNGSWWSATGYNANTAWRRRMDAISEQIDRVNLEKNRLFSIRCVKDLAPILTEEERAAKEALAKATAEAQLAEVAEAKRITAAKAKEAEAKRTAEIKRAAEEADASLW